MNETMQQPAGEIDFYLAKMKFPELRVIVSACYPGGALHEPTAFARWMFQSLMAEADRRIALYGGGEVHGPIKAKLDASGWSGAELIDSVNHLSEFALTQGAPSILEFCHRITFVMLNEIARRISH